MKLRKCVLLFFLLCVALVITAKPKTIRQQIEWLRNERKINYSDLVLRRGDSAATINEKLLTEQTEHIFSEDQALEILSDV